jgi:DNA polymerase (family 10)
VIGARITNEEIARQFDEVADVLGLRDANPFRVRAFRNAGGMIRPNRQAQTDRQARTMKNRLLIILSQPSRTIALRSAPYDVDPNRLVGAAKAEDVFLEITADVARLDVGELECRQAKEAGILLTVSSEAHSAQELPNMRHALCQARRGGLEASDVLSTRPYGEVGALLRNRRRKT